MVEAILWDNDGVLVDTERLYFKATQQALKLAGVDLSLDLYKDVSLRQGAGLFYLASERGYTDAQVAELRAKRDDIYTELLQAEPLLFPAVYETLSELHKKYRMAIVTSSRRIHFDVMHEATKIEGFFEFVLAREDYLNSKPEPEPYLTAMQKPGLPAEKCVAIEDTERGLVAARDAGLRCIVIPHAFTQECKFEGAEAVLKSIAELPALLAKM